MKERERDLRYDTWFTSATQHRVSTSLGMEIWTKRYRVLTRVVAPVVFIIIFVFSSFLLLSVRPSGVGHPPPLHAFVPAMACLVYKIIASSRVSVCLTGVADKRIYHGRGRERKEKLLLSGGFVM